VPASPHRRASESGIDGVEFDRLDRAVLAGAELVGMVINIGCGGDGRTEAELGGAFDDHVGVMVDGEHAAGGAGGQGQPGENENCDSQDMNPRCFSLPHARRDRRSMLKFSATGLMVLDNQCPALRARSRMVRRGILSRSSGLTWRELLGGRVPGLSRSER
jgi:hypothetical protein